MLKVCWLILILKIAKNTKIIRGLLWSYWWFFGFIAAAAVIWTNLTLGLQRIYSAEYILCQHNVYSSTLTYKQNVQGYNNLSLFRTRPKARLWTKQSRGIGRKEGNQNKDVGYVTQTEINNFFNIEIDKYIFNEKQETDVYPRISILSLLYF